MTPRLFSTPTVIYLQLSSSSSSFHHMIDVVDISVLFYHSNHSLFSCASFIITIWPPAQRQHQSFTINTSTMFFFLKKRGDFLAYFQILWQFEITNLQERRKISWQKCKVNVLKLLVVLMSLKSGSIVAVRPAHYTKEELGIPNPVVLHYENLLDISSSAVECIQSEFV